MNHAGLAPLPLALTALVALFSALAALAISGGPAAHAHGDGSQRPARRRRSQTTRLTQGGRAPRGHAPALGRPHRLDAAGDHQPHDGLARHRGHRRQAARNQTDIGNAVKPFYGKAAGNKLTASCASTS